MSLKGCAPRASVTMTTRSLHGSREGDTFQHSGSPAAKYHFTVTRTERDTLVLFWQMGTQGFWRGRLCSELRSAPQSLHMTLLCLYNSGGTRSGTSEPRAGCRVLHRQAGARQGSRVSDPKCPAKVTSGPQPLPGRLRPPEKKKRPAMIKWKVMPNFSAPSGKDPGKPAPAFATPPVHPKGPSTQILAEAGQPWIPSPALAPGQARVFHTPACHGPWIRSFSCNWLGIGQRCSPWPFLHCPPPSPEASTAQAGICTGLCPAMATPPYQATLQLAIGS